MSITITLSHDMETLETLRDEWTDLHNRSTATGVALTWQVIYTYYKHHVPVGELWIMTARENNRLIGIAPLIKIEEQPSRGFAWQQLEFIGTHLEHEHLDFIIEPGYEEQLIPLFIDKLYEYRPRWDVISLVGMSDTKTLDILQQSDRDWIELPKKNMPAPYMELPDTIDEWLQTLTSKRRWSLRRDLKKLDEQFPNRWAITQITQPDQLDETFDQLVEMHQAYWEERGASGTFYYGVLADYYRDLSHCLLENGWLRLYRLDIDDEPCAIDLCYHYRGRAYGHITTTKRGFTNIAFGIVLKQHCFEQAIKEGLDEFSFMYGAVAWKNSFATAERVHRAFRLVGSPRVRLQLQTVDMLRGVKSQLVKIKSQVSEIESDAPREDDKD